jgi:hypothetical protein
MSVNIISDFICDIESKIQFDKVLVPPDFTCNTPANSELLLSNFGIINLKIKQKTPNHVKRHFVFTMDCSGSMNDLCDDGRSKNEHSNHTLINMIRYFAEHPELMVSITVFAFDGIIYNIIQNEDVTQDNLVNLIQNVKKIHPKDITNIEKALTNSRDYISDYLVNNPDTYVSHIFMTDGDATQGSELPSQLKKLVAPIVPNIFIGFGVDHNAYLLRELSSETRNNYYFVDALEKSGLVYGEILHSIIYRVLENTNVRVINGLIYDWKKNMWVHEIDVGDLISDNNKVFHILSDKPQDFSCIVETTDCISKEIYNLCVQNTINQKYINDDTDVDADADEDVNVIEYIGFSDLTKYKYRQRTQQLIFEVNVYNFKKYKTNDVFDEDNNNTDLHESSVKLKEKMKDLLKEMQDFLKILDQNIDSDYNFIKLLCDDIYVCLQTFDTSYGAMFSCARQASQGAQRTYSATSTPKTLKSNRILRNTNRYYTNDNQNLSFDLDQDLDHDTPLFVSNFNDDELNNDNFGKEFYQVMNDYDADNDEEDMDYNLSTEYDNPYSTLSILDLMRSCSSNNTN